MSDDLSYFDKIVDRDFLFYLHLTRTCFENLKDQNEKKTCELWLTYLVGKTYPTSFEKCNRNVFYSRLLLQMHSGKLKGIFLEPPPPGNLPCAFVIFGLPNEIDGLKGFEELGFQVDSNIAGASGDFFESSRDGRTYLATKTLPDGIMAFLAVTNNDGEEIWVPQTCPPVKGTCDPKTGAEKKGGFVKKLAQFVKIPLTNRRESQEERERVMEWMDKMISDCNKWIQGEDPHNPELDILFKLLYNDYKNDPEKAEIFKHPKKVRTILMKQIRESIIKKRSDISKRELILDQYEGDEYVEELQSSDLLDNVWIQTARKPMNDSVKMSLEKVYPPEVIDRFFELLVQERLDIIQKGEKEAKKKIAEMRASSVEDIKKALNKLKKAQDDYKEYYCAFKDIEQKYAEYEREYKEKCGQSGGVDQQKCIEKAKKELETEIEQAKQRFDKERKTQNELMEKLEEAKDNYLKVQERMNQENERLSCESEQLCIEKEEIQNQICALKRRKEELICKFGNFECQTDFQSDCLKL